MKRIVSMIVAIAIVLGFIPMGDIVVHAADKATIEKIIVNKTYNSLEDLGEFFITITGDNLDKAMVRIIKTGGELVQPQKSNASGRYVAQYSYRASEIGERLFIDGKEYSLGEDVMPRITGRGGATDNIIDSGEDITLTGENIANLKSDSGINIEGYFVQATSKRNITDGDIDGAGNTVKIIKNMGTALGTHSLVFKQKENKDDIDIEIEHTYRSIVIVRGELNLTGRISLFPTQGPVNSTVTITADTIESNVSIFLMKKGEDYEYTKGNMALNDSIKHSKEDGKEKLVFKVPNTVGNGPYDIVLTNRVDPNININEQISKYKVLGNDESGEFKKLEFIVVDGDSSVDLRRIAPNYSSIKGTTAQIEGRNIGRLSTNIYTIGKLDGEKSKDGLDESQLVLTYRDGTYNGEAVKTLTRTITVQIGSYVSFTGYNFEGDVFDYLDIIVPENDNLDKPVKDVIIFIEDEIEFIDGRKVTRTETDSIINGFTYKEIDYQPNIKTIIPNIIQVDNENKVIEDIIISISGDNFLKYGYTEDGELKIKNPEISIDKQNNSSEWFDNKNIRIYNQAGVELEDKLEEQLGNIIKIKVKKGSLIPELIINTPSNLKVQNPLAVESDGDKGSSALGEIRFVKVSGDKTPNITEVVPNIVTTAGENGIKIRGSNFGVGVKIYLDGEEIRGVNRNGTGTELIFNAPPRPEGIYQIIVQNEEGGLATYDNFVYVKTYTDIKLNDFNPKKGSANTLVTIKGENFVRPDPLVADLTGMGIYKLIGTRVLLGTKDVNEYHMEGNQITLQGYESSGDNKIIKIEDGRLKLSDYYHSVIFEDNIQNRKYYSIYFDTNSGDIKLTDGDKNVYIIEIKDNQIIATKGGVEYELTINTNSIIISEGDNKKTLKFKTPYKVEDNLITGNKVKVINNRELIFRVPAMDKEGYYDLTVINPDTKKDSKTGNNGFYYSFQPEHKPQIKDIKPNQGSVDGQYYINISGEGFIDRGGDYKTSVIIGTVKVDPKDVEVSPDGKNIKVKVPKYPGDLTKETDMDRKAVAVVVVNPDGGSDSVEDGFSYIIPISHPRIDRLILNKGSAAGGESVIIEGSGFRFFEPFKDLNNNSEWDEGEPHTELNFNDNKWDDLRYWRSEEHKDAYEELAKDYENLVEPILPKVYFGGTEVRIIEFTASTIEVETPKGEKGTVEVYIVNNDHGVSNKVNFTYVASTPRIRSITPNTGRKQGGDKLEILGEGFHESKVKVIETINTTKEETLQLIQFGNPKDTNISNRDVPIDAPQNSGRIRDRLSTVKVGSLTVKYDASQDIRKLSFSLVENDIEYQLNNVDYNDGEIFLPLNLLKDKDGNNYDGYEYVRISLERVTGATTTNRLRVDRGFSPEATLTNPGHINVNTPSYYTIGTIPINVINPDGGIATGNFQYKNPDSNPEIHNILRDGEEGYTVDDGRTIVQVNYLGGNTMEVIGIDFRKPVTIRIGDSIVIPHQAIEYHPENESVSTRLIFKMPGVDRRYIDTYQRLIVENEDGGFATSEPIYIKFTEPESTDLTITKVTPNFGPTEGGTIITIEGKDFRSQMEGFPGSELKVYFGSGSNQIRVPAENIISITFDKIVMRTPAFTAGPAHIKVENPDGNIAELPNGFIYVSNPKIISLVNPDNDKVVIETISVEGGEKIKIIGSDFMPGAKVIFNPVLRPLLEGEQATGEIITIGTNRFVLESGVEGREVEVISGQEITVTTPPGKLGDKGVIVINPDKGATNIYNVSYGIPEIGAPLNVVAELVFDEFIRVHWSGVRDAFEYEIYMSENGGKFEFIGSTELTSFAVQKIKPQTRYQFLVRAIGKYGTSKPIDESKSKTVTTSRTAGPKDNDGKPGEHTVINRNGNIADIVIGSKDFTSKGITIDLTRGNLAGVTDITLRIPANIVVSSPGEINILGKDYTMKFRPNVFQTSTLRDNKDNPNAGVVFKVLVYKGNVNTNPGSTIIGESYSLEGNIYIGKDISNMDYLNGNLNFTLDADILKAQSRRLNNISLVRYDNNTKNWTPVTHPNRLGLYTVIGRR